SASFSLSIQGQAISFQLEPTKGRKLSLRPALTGDFFRILCPSKRMESHIPDFLAANEAWILEQYARLQQREQKREKWKHGVLTGQFGFMGIAHQLYFEPAHRATVTYEEEKQRFRIQIPASRQTDAATRSFLAYQALQKVIHRALVRKTQELAKETGDQFQTVRTKNQLTKWGSCSSRRAINLNAHLAFLPDSVRDYIIIHELMHLREMNHSARFWNLVAQYCPNYQQEVKQLTHYDWLIGTLNGWEAEFK
ncbi:MAG: SprT family zinc-dependent metalloprotease, partial [Bacteroidota bacterium]